MNHLDIINCRFANPLSPTQTEVHYAYFAHQDDDPELVRHRVRQSSNLIGPSGFISLEDGAVFGRIQKALHAEPDRIRYLRGWQDSSARAGALNYSQGVFFDFVPVRFCHRFVAAGDAQVAVFEVRGALEGGFVICG